jgi:hypothetical protein
MIFLIVLFQIYINVKNKIIKSEISKRNLVYYKNNTIHNVISYYKKEQHLSINTYSDILTDMNKLYLSLHPTINKKLISIDGTYDKY